MVRLAKDYCTKALGEYKDLGFIAYEADDHTLIIEHFSEVIARFNAHAATIENIQRACHQHYNEDIVDAAKHFIPYPKGLEGY